METDQEEKRALGLRLKSARTLKSWKQDYVAGQLGITKAALSAWETGRNMPDALFLKRLAKLYETSVDALLWENSLSPEAMQIAAQFDHLKPDDQRRLRSVWMAFVTSAATDAEVEARMPITKNHNPTHEPEESP